MQKVATLDTCCDVACLTFNLTHITTEPIRFTATQHNRLFPQPTTFGGKQRTFIQINKIGISQVSAVNFFRGGGGGQLHSHGYGSFHYEITQ